MGDAQIDKVWYAEFGGRANSVATRNEVHGTKLGSLGRRGMGNTPELDKCIAGTHQVLVGLRIERIPRRRFTSCRQLALRARPHQRAHPMTAFDQNRNQAVADIAGSSGDKHMPRIRRLWKNPHTLRQSAIGDRCGHSFSTLLRRVWIPSPAREV